MGKPVLLLHGWLGKPDSFGALPELLAADGHRVLPVFRSYESHPRSKRLEDLADELEATLQEQKIPQQLDAPMVIIAHSMGGLLARTWMLRHYLSKGRRPPVERLFACASPHHGVHLAPVGRAAVWLGAVPGTALARQMTAPNPFLWDLAWNELKHADLLPETVGLAAYADTTAMHWICGGTESDGVVPAVFSNPNPVYLKSGAGTQRLPERCFVTYRGYLHHGPRGLIHHLRAENGKSASPVGALLRAGVCESPLAIRAREGPAALEPLRRSIAILRYPPNSKARPGPRLEIQDGRTTRHLKPLAIHPTGLALFGWNMREPGASLHLRFEHGANVFAAAYDDEANTGLVFYSDLRG